jgi:hypothetical protein
MRLCPSKLTARAPLSVPERATAFNPVGLSTPLRRVTENQQRVPCRVDLHLKLLQMCIFPVSIPTRTLLQFIYYVLAVAPRHFGLKLRSFLPLHSYFFTNITYSYAVLFVL